MDREEIDRKLDALRQEMSGHKALVLEALEEHKTETRAAFQEVERALLRLQAAHDQQTARLEECFSNSDS